MIIKILAEGGEMKPGPALSQKLGPVGIPINSVIQKVNEATKDMKGMKVPVELDVNPSTKEFVVRVFSPPTSELIKKEIGIEKGSGQQKNIKIANVSIEQIISVTKIKFPNLLCKNMKSAVKTVIGSCLSLGILIENKSPQEMIKEIDGGKYDTEILQEKSQTSGEKKKLLDEFFSKIQVEQDKILKQQEAAKESEEAKVGKTEPKEKEVKEPEKAKKKK